MIGFFIYLDIYIFVSAQPKTHRSRSKGSCNQRKKV